MREGHTNNDLNQIEIVVNNTPAINKDQNK